MTEPNDLFKYEEGDLPDDVLGLIDVEESSLSDRPHDRTEAEQRLPKPDMVSASTDQIVTWDRVALDIEVTDRISLDREIEVFEMSGQCGAVVVRRVGNGYEAIGRTWLVEVIREFNRAHPDDRREVMIEVRDLDDKAAYRLVAQELEGGPPISSLERGRFYQQAIQFFKSEAAFARECGVHKSTIHRNLDVARVVDYVGDHVLIHRDIAQADAEWFMKIVGRESDPDSTPAAKALLDAVAALSVQPMPAKQVFGKLRRAAADDKPKKGGIPLEHAGKQVGTIRRTSASAPIKIVLDNAGDVELDALVEILRAAIDRVRRTQMI